MSIVVWGGPAGSDDDDGDERADDGRERTVA
jgi:hypothetical protein